MNSELPVLRSRTTPAVATPPRSYTPGGGELSEMMQFAQNISKADMLPPQFKGKPSNVLWAMLKADQVGKSAIWAMEEINVIQNRPTISAAGMRDLCISAGHRWRVIESTDELCTVEIMRRDDPDYPHRETYTMEMAKQSGDAASPNYKKYPKRMLLARATSNAVTAACPEVLMGVAQYTPEDLEIVDGGKAGVPSGAVQADPLSIEVDPVEAENGDSSTGTADAGSTTDEPVISQHEAVLRPKMRGDILAMIGQLDLPQRDKLKDWMSAKGWVLATLTSGELADVMAYVSAMVPPDDEPAVTVD